MGTSGAYTGAGGKPGRDIAAGAAEWVNSLTADGAGQDDLGDGNQPEERPVTFGADRQPVELPRQLVSGALALLSPRSTRGASRGGIGGSSGGVGGSRSSSGGASGGGSGLRRSVARAAGSAGRAGAAAYAYATGDRGALSAIGLDYDSLRALGDPFQITQRIVDAACGQLSGGSLESHEERYVAASVAEWVFELTESGSPPTPEEIARHSIAVIVAEVIATEINESLNNKPEAIAALAESELIEAAEILAGRAELSVNGATVEELSAAIEDGIESLRQIYSGGP